VNNIVIAGIGTDVGKTIASAIIVERLGYAYWKPIQTGLDSDTQTVRHLVSNPDVSYFKERFSLKMPASPHIAAQKEQVNISIQDLVLPSSSHNLLIELAGGLMVPINSNGDTFLDVMNHWNAEVILVSKYYLGSINHTLLSILALKHYGIPIKGIVYNGQQMEGTKEIIQSICNLPILIEIENEVEFTKEKIRDYSRKITWNTI
jgi:dethiobiotin synthetase